MLGIRRPAVVKMSVLQLFCILSTIPVNISAEILKFLGNTWALDEPDSLGKGQTWRLSTA